MTGASSTRALKMAEEILSLRFGPATAEQPEPSEFASQLTIGHVGMQLDALEIRTFGVDKLEISVYHDAGTGRRIQSRSLREVGVFVDRLYKAWEVSKPGTYTVEVVDPATQTMLAHGDFVVVGG